ncbi:MAG: hypothetical protein Q4F35_05480 [Akkermansia sp.]|nr:hypothetical protein [Akkermansia sp.]
MPNDVAASYAMQNTKVLYVPDRRIDTFGDTRFNFLLLSEPMDAVGHCRIRSGWVEANRPRILRPADLCEIEMEGFGPSAREFFDWMAAHGAKIQALLKYGFRFSRSEVKVEYLHENVREVADRVVREALNSGDAFRAVVQGVDDAWEVSLLCFMLEMIQQSHDINFFDFKRRGLI